jgi:putative ABC transport system permease protein
MVEVRVPWRMRSRLTLPRPLRLALRRAARQPASFLIALATVAIVTAAAAAVAAVATAAFVRPLPFPEPGRLVRLYTMPPGATAFRDANPFHPREFVRFRERLGPFDAVEGIWAREQAIGGDGEPGTAQVGSVSGGFLRLLGNRPALGRALTEDDDAQAARVVVLGHSFWLSRFGGDTGVLGRTLPIDRVPHEIVGVMPPEFEPAFTRTELWTPLGFRDGRWVLENATFIQTVGRLKTGVDAAAARSEAEAMLDAVRVESPLSLTGWRLGLLPLREAQFGQQRPAILMLVVSVVVVALIATANLAHLTLADLLSRRAEIGMCIALGASRADLFRSHLGEALLVTSAGGLAGLVIASAALPVLKGLDPTGLTSQVAIQIDWRAGLAALLLTGAVTGLATLVPVWRAADRGIAHTAAGIGRRTIGGRRQTRARTWLVAIEMGLAVILLCAGAVLVTAFHRMAKIDPGFDPADVITAQLRLSDVAHPMEAARTAFVETMLQRVRAVPGVAHASTTLNRFVPGLAFVTLIHVDGQPTPTGEPHTVQFRRVSTDYFETLRIPLLEGRAFDGRDVKAGEPVAIVSESLARRFWPEQSPVGRRLRRAGPMTTIVGVVGDVRDVRAGHAPEATLYIPYAQNNTNAAPVALVVRSARAPHDLVPALKAAIREIDPAQPLSNVLPLAEFLDRSRGAERFRTTLLIAFAGIGALLACAGIYGVTGRSVIERRQEAGVRLALGATARQVWWTAASRALAALAIGAGGGAAAAMLVIRTLPRVVPEVADTPALAASSAALALLMAAGAAAALIPARRAAHVDPVLALRAH